MSAPPAVAHCPPGLECLATLDHLFVKQQVELIEAITGFETNNKYDVKNSLGEKVYWVVEENDCWTRNCCGYHRPFVMKLMDHNSNTVIQLQRPLRCSVFCFPCCLQSLTVEAPPGHRIGSVQQEWSVFYPKFAVRDETGETVMRIDGPFCRYSFCGSAVDFKITNSDGEQVGKISKQWSGLAREWLTDADFFGINFPMNMDVKMKAVMLGSCILIDAMFFENA